MAARFIEKSKGTINVQSTNNRFEARVHLPIFYQQVVLLIDDNDSWQQFAAATLKAVGYKLTLSGDNYSADNYAQYDLILIDDILTGGDSLTIMQAIQAAGAIGKTVAVTSNPRVERAKVRMLLGLRNLLPKPYTPIEFLTEIKKALNAGR